MKNTFLILNFGCKVNAYESEGISEFLLSQGLRKTDKNPDYIIINTCAVTRVAEKKCLFKLHSLSKENPNSRILVCGCSSQINAEEYLSAQNVKVVTGNSGKIAAVKRLLDNEMEQLNLVKNDVRHECYEQEMRISRFGEECRAFIKIQDGCNNFCSYCVIPWTRGNSRSRPANEVLEEIKNLFDEGYMEVVITGIDTGSYIDPTNPSYKFSSLLEDIIKITPDGKRIRISSLEMGQIDERIINCFVNHQDKLVKHLHIPLQSGSDKVLKAMNRHYDLSAFLKVVERIKSLIKGFAFSTDVIVGFPTEGEEEFNETIEFIKRVGFMRLHVFPYSPRPNTYAAKLEQVPQVIKKERVKRLIDLGNDLSKKYIIEQDGTIIKVLFETSRRKENKTIYTGYSDNYIEVNLESNEDLINKTVDVKINNGQFVLK